MEVKDRLPGVGAVVGQDAIAGLDDPLLVGNLRCQGEKIGRQIAVARSQIVKGRDVPAGYD
jgi:hypothetical protein